MTDYNDGLWHGWNGEECPVHAESVVDVVFSNSFGDMLRDTRAAGAHIWNHHIIDSRAKTYAFRVVKAYREPREGWVLVDDSGRIVSTVFSAKCHADCFCQPGQSVIHVREVIE